MKTQENIQDPNLDFHKEILQEIQELHDQKKEVAKLINAAEKLLILLRKPIPFSTACLYLNIKEPTLYELTSAKSIGFYKPRNKLIYFEKKDLDNWVFRERIKPRYEIEQEALTYTTKNKMNY